MADVTVIIPASRPGTLNRCLEYLKSSRDVSYRLIVVLGNDSRQLRQMALKAGGEVIEHYAKGEQHKARALALAEVKTEFVHFLDDDDFIHPQFLYRGVRLLREDGNCDVAFSLPFFSTGVEENSLPSFMQPGFVNPSCTIYRTSAIRQAFSLMPKEMISTSEDKMYTLILASVMGVKFRCFRAPVTRGNYSESGKIWDTLMPKSLYDYWYTLLLKIPHYQDDAVADFFVRYVLSETRKWYSQCAIYSLPVSTEIMKIRGSSGYRPSEKWPNLHRA